MIGLLKVAARAFSRHPDVGSTPSYAVHRENKWQLLRYHRQCSEAALARRSREMGSAAPANRIRRGEGAQAPRREQSSDRTRPIVLVPSLINRHFILDLGPGRSVVEHFVARGRDVYMIDWGAPEDEDRFVTFDDIADRAIGRAIRVALRESGADKVHLLGYCLGGTLAAIHTAAHPEKIATLTALATPIDFHDGGLLSCWVRTASFDAEALVAATGNVPASLLQASFQMLRPTLALAKGVRLLDRAGDERFLDAFFALETWANDNVAFPGAAYATYVDLLYRKNSLARGTMTLSGHPARLDAIRCPLLVVAFPDDPIVPIESARALIRLATNADVRVIERRGGHVGAVVSQSAQRELWPEVGAFYDLHEKKRRSSARAPTAIAAHP